MQRQSLPARPARADGPAAKPCEILIAVLPGVSLLGLGCLIEPLRHLRQIERLFQRHLNCSPRQYYLDLQLALAWQLCEQTEMSLLEVALASGFGANSSLARRFRQRFAVSPTELRASRLP